MVRRMGANVHRLFNGIETRKTASVSDSQVHRPRVIANFQLSQLISKMVDRILMPLAEVIDLIELT